MLTVEQIIGIVIGGLILLLLLFMTVRTFLCKAPKIDKCEISLVEIDRDGAAKRLSEAVSIATVTPKYPLEEQSESVHQTFLDFHAFLEKSYPLVFARAEKTVIHKLSLVLKIDGSDSSLLPACFLGHMDVVPAPSDGWETDPFGGEIKDGYVYGRGSQDMKSQLLASIESLEILLKGGFNPKRTIYYCFGHDEELTGKEGAEQIVTYLKENKIRMEYVIDEGGTLLDGASLGISGKVALIGTCEKGYADFLLTAQMDGGHGSSPKKNSAVDTLADAILDLKAIPMRAYWSMPVKQMFAHLAPELKGIFKFIMVNRDILAPLLKVVLTKAHPITNALLRTTFSFTQLSGAEAPNVIPRKASVNVNCRINIGQTKEQARAHIQKVVGKNIIVTEPFENYDPSPVSNPNSEVFKTLSSTIRQVFDGFIPAPYPFIAASDAKHYYDVSDNVYRFTPFLVTPDDQERIHAINERCEIAGLESAIQFYAQFILKTC